MNKRIPVLISSALLALPGGVLLAAGQVAQQINPADLNKDIVQGLLNITGLFLAILLPIAGQQLLKLKSEIKTARTEVKDTKENSVSTVDMEKVTGEITLLQNSVQTLKDDLRVTAIERDTITIERNALRTEKAALVEQHAEETHQWEKRYSELEAKVEQLEQWKVNRESTDETISRFKNEIYGTIKELITLAKMSTSERKAVEVGELKPAT